jgi:hypothetical protein
MLACDDRRRVSASWSLSVVEGINHQALFDNITAHRVRPSLFFNCIALCRLWWF